MAYWASHLGGPPRGGLGAADTANAPNTLAGDRDSIDLSDAQLAAVKVEPVGERDFPRQKEAVGSIDFDEEMSVQVFTPYAGRIIGLFASVGDDVKKGQTLFTIDSPDLLQAESTLIAAAGVHPQSGAPERTLYDAGSVAARSGSRYVRPADCRR
jgi:cobalt-zinc-cadmium efflux system membrane fusion protein